MKNYKMYPKVDLGYSDIACLVCMGGREKITDSDDHLKAHVLHFGGDNNYSAYLVDEDCEIPSYYELVAEFSYWLKVYDDCKLVYTSWKLEGNHFHKIYRAGDYGCIIQLSRKKTNEVRN